MIHPKTLANIIALAMHSLDQLVNQRKKKTKKATIHGLGFKSFFFFPKINRPKKNEKAKEQYHT